MKTTFSKKTTRFEHACGFFGREADVTLIVAGGAVDQLTKDSATATVELLLPGASSWIQATPLPKAQGGVRAGSHLDGSGILLTGIERSVLRYNPKSEEWEEVSKGNATVAFLLQLFVIFLSYFVSFVLFLKF